MLLQPQRWQTDGGAATSQNTETSLLKVSSGMREQLQKRLEELKAELDAGQKMLNDLETQRDTLRQTLLRISGAVQVLEEELAKAVE